MPSSDELAKLDSLIDGHCAAMKAQARDPKVKLEISDDGGQTWDADDRRALMFSAVSGPNYSLWSRIAPAPKLVSLDKLHAMIDEYAKTMHAQVNDLA